MLEKTPSHTGIATTTLPAFLRNRRERLAPIETERRRTPGLRREEVAARAGVSVTWYTWLEQGRGGVPSEDVLERLAGALELDATNREILFLLAHDRPPPRTHALPAIVTPALQRVLDSMAVPAFIKTATCQIVAWNRVAVAVLGDYAAVPERERNLLRRVFEPGSENKVENVEQVRRTCIAAFRVDVARVGPSPEATALIDELMQGAEFRRLWAEGDIRAHGTFQKRILRGGVEIELESSVFDIEGSAGLSMFVWSPVNEASALAIKTLVAGDLNGDRERAAGIG